MIDALWLWVLLLSLSRRYRDAMAYSHRVMLTLLLLVSVLARLFFVWFFGDVDFEPDSYLHFIYSESAFTQLPASLNHAAGVWPKPLFTLLCGSIVWISGVHALWIIKVFNTLLWGGVAFLTYRLSHQVGLSDVACLISVFLTSFSFLGFRASIGTLTEPMFALIVLAAIVALYAQHYTTSCVFVSLSSLVRSEGLVLILGWCVILWTVCKRRCWHDLVSLAIFPALWNLWGYLLRGDPTFILTSGYPISSAPYGHGGWFDYPVGLLKYEPMLFPLALLGLGLTVSRRVYRPLHVLLGFFMGFNVIAWRFGLFGTAGILRYFVPIVPWLAVYAAAAFDLTKLILAYRSLNARGMNLLLVQVVFTLLVLNSRTAGYRLYNTPTVHPALIRGGRWIQVNRADDYVYASHPALLYYAGRDFTSSAMISSPAQIHRNGVMVFDRDFGSARLRAYLARLPLLEAFENYLFVYDHDLTSVEARPTLDFAEADIQRYLREGWSGVEEWGTWAVGTYSELVLWFATPRDVTISISVFPQSIQGHQQSVMVHYNETSVGEFEFPKEASDPLRFSFDVPKALISGRLDVLRFSYDYAVSPQDLGVSGDSRPLAVGFLEMTITESP